MTGLTDARIIKSSRPGEDGANPSAEHISEVTDQLLREFADVFDLASLEMPAMVGKPMAIHLRPDA